MSATQDKTETALELFQFSSPGTGGASAVLRIDSRVNDANEVVGVTMKLDKRKTIAGRMNLPVKAAAVTEAIRKAQDVLLQAGLAEISMAASKGNLTGARFTRSKSKTGQRVTLSAVTPEVRTVSAEQMESAFVKMTPAQQAAFLAKVKELEKSGLAPVEVAGIVSSPQQARK